MTMLWNVMQSRCCCQFVNGYDRTKVSTSKFYFFFLVLPIDSVYCEKIHSIQLAVGAFTVCVENVILYKRKKNTNINKVHLFLGCYEVNFVLFNVSHWKGIITKCSQISVGKSSEKIAKDNTCKLIQMLLNFGCVDSPCELFSFGL